MAFKYYGTLDSNEGQTIIGDKIAGQHKTILANSITISIGDAVITNSAGNVALAAAGNPILGIVTDILFNDTRIRDDLSEDTYTVEGDNLTDKLVYVKIDISRKSLWSASQDGTAGTTNNSNERGAYIDLVSENQLNETDATRTRGTGGQFTTFGDDRDDTTRLIVAINESELVSAT